MKKILIAWIGAWAAVIIVISVLSIWIDERKADYLHNDKITDCRPPGDQGEKLIATLSKSADGGPLEIHCSYHATLGMAP